MQKFRLDPITPNVGHRISQLLAENTEDEALKLYRVFSQVSGTVSDMVFISHIHHTFSKAIDLEARPMIRTSKPSCWRATFSNPSVPSGLQRVCSEVQLHRVISLSVEPKSVSVFSKSGSEKITIEPDTLYIPKPGSNVGFDSFIVHENKLVLFRITTAHIHIKQPEDIQAALEGQFTGLPSPSEWFFIFTVPKSLDRFECPHTDGDFFSGHIPYAAKIETTGIDDEFTLALEK
jgi:hypothetical protein